MKTSELTGPALDWAVAKIEGVRAQYRPEEGMIISNLVGWVGYRPSVAWAQGGPIIEREGIGTRQMSLTNEWAAKRRPTLMNTKPKAYFGPTPLIAAMRCFVANKLGDEVELPEELQ